MFACINTILAINIHFAILVSGNAFINTFGEYGVVAIFYN